MMIYDCEIIKAIPSTKEPKIDGVEYCEGWKDYANMGVSVIGVYDYVSGRYGVFLEDNIEGFRKLIKMRDVLVGFNSIGFDNQLLAANDVTIPKDKCYDLLAEIWKAAKLAPKFNWKTHGGYGLNAVATANIGAKKTGYGGSIPIDWQQGRIGRVINYCLHDVWLTKGVLDLVIENGEIKNPKLAGVLKMEKPQWEKA